jgi:hypothetical protein
MLHAPRELVELCAATRATRAAGECVRRFCLRSKLVSGLARFFPLRVDRREGREGARESSRSNVVSRAACAARLRAAVEVPPLRRSLELLPGSDVSTTSPNARMRGGAGARGGPRLMAAALNRSALVAIGDCVGIAAPWRKEALERTCKFSLPVLSFPHPLPFAHRLTDRGRSLEWYRPAGAVAGGACRESDAPACGRARPAPTR